MKRSTIFGLVAAGAVMVAGAFAPISAKADSLQDEKNNMRNLAILGGAAALYGATHGNSTMAIVGALGAAAAGSQYEKDRQTQSRENDYYGYNWNGGRYRHNWGGDRNYYRDNQDYGRYNQDYGRYNQDYRDRDYRDRDDNRDRDDHGDWGGDRGHGRYNHGWNR